MVSVTSLPYLVLAPHHHFQVVAMPLVLAPVLAVVLPHSHSHPILTVATNLTLALP